MPRASKRPVNKNVEEEIQDNFSFLISSLTSPKDIQSFFETFLTSEEKIMLTKRFMLHLMVESGYSVVDIASVLSVSKETAYKHQDSLSREDKVYKDIIAKLINRRKTKEFWKKVEKALRPLELAMQARTNMRARAKIISGDYD